MTYTVTTIATTADNCPDVTTCPAKDVIAELPGRVYLIANEETDPAVIAEFSHRIGPGEKLVWQPSVLHPEVSA